MSTKAELQEQQYHFPYHHLSHENDGSFYIFRHLFWGMEHYSYISVVKKIVSQLQPKTIADIGCGEGRLVSDFEKLLPESTVSGSDISQKAISFARAFCKTNQLSVHNIVDNALVSQHECVVSCEVIEHIEPEKVPTYISNVFASTKPGGTIIMTTPTTNVPVNAKHFQHFTSEQFDELLDGYCSHISYTYLNVPGRISWLLNRLLANRIYLSNLPFFNRLVYRLYCNYRLFGTKETGGRILVVATKKAS